MSDVNLTRIFLTDFWIYTNFIKICPVGAELFRTDGRTDRQT